MDGMSVSLSTALITIIISFFIAFLIKIMVIILEKTSKPEVAVVNSAPVTATVASNDDSDIAAVLAIVKSQN